MINIEQIDRLMQHHTAVLGKTGAGKTYTSKVLIERAYQRGDRVCILDPIKSDWWGLTSSADGKKPGLPFSILGGPHAHVPLHSGAGRAIAEIVASGELQHSIIDMAEFEAGGSSKFFIDFAEMLMKKMRGVLFLVLEEAHEFAPKERSGMGEESVAIHFAKRLATAGRSKGIRLILATQRTQSLHNALLGSCETLIAHRMTAPADQKPVNDWLKSNLPPTIAQEIASNLSGLKTGHAYLCSGELQIHNQVQFPRITTYDNSATPTNNDKRVEIKQANVDHARLEAIIGEAVEVAKANDPKLLKAKIAELERRIKDGTRPAAEKIVERVEVPIVSEDDHRVIGRLTTLFDDLLECLSEYKKDIVRIIGGVHEASITGGSIILDEPSSTSSVIIKKQILNGVELKINHEKNHNKSLKGERLVLSEIAPHKNGCTPVHIKLLTGYKTRTVQDYIKRLIDYGWAERNGKHVVSTASGIKELGRDYRELPRGNLLKHYSATLPSGEATVFNALCSVSPRPMTTDDVVSECGFAKRTAQDYLSRLRVRELVFPVKGRSYRLADALIFD